MILALLHGSSLHRHSCSAYYTYLAYCLVKPNTGPCRFRAFEGLHWIRMAGSALRRLMAEYKQMSQVWSAATEAASRTSWSNKFPHWPADQMSGLEFCQLYRQFSWSCWNWLVNFTEAWLFRTLLMGLQRALSLRRTSLTGKQLSQDLRFVEMWKS